MYTISIWRSAEATACVYVTAAAQFISAQFSSQTSTNNKKMSEIGTQRPEEVWTAIPVLAGPGCCAAGDCAREYSVPPCACSSLPPTASTDACAGPPPPGRVLRRLSPFPLPSASRDRFSAGALLTRGPRRRSVGVEAAHVDVADLSLASASVSVATRAAVARRRRRPMTFFGCF